MKQKLKILILSICLVAVIVFVVSAMLKVNRLRQPGIIVNDVSDRVAAVKSPGLDEALVSKPLDPWSIEPVFVDTMYVTLPFLNEEGIITETGFELRSNLQQAMFPYYSRNVGAMRGDYLRGLVERMSDYSPKEEYLLTDELLSNLIKFVQPTHIIGGTYREEGDQWKILVYITEGDNRWEKEFSFNQESYFIFRTDVVEWMASCGAFVVEEDKQQFLGRYPYGEKVNSFADDLCTEMKMDPGHEEWVRLEEEFGVNPIHQYFRIWAAINSENMELIEEIMPEPLGADGSCNEYLARVYGLSNLGHRNESVHECEMLMSLYPGNFSIADYYIFQIFPDGQFREDFYHSVDEWYVRVSQYPLAYVMMGDACRKVAFDYRGDGYTNTVSQNSWSKFSEYGMKSIDMYSKVLEFGVNDPYVVGKLIGINEGLGVETDKSLAHMYSAANQFPDCSDPWSRMLHYMRPRWGRSLESGMELIDEAMASRPNNHEFGKLAVAFHELEAQLNQEGGWTYVKEYAESFPEGKRQLMDSYERLSAKQAPDYLAAHALCVGAMLQDEEMILKVLEERPDVYKSLNYYTGFSGWVGRTRLYLVHCQSTLGQWEELGQALETIREDDKYYHDQGEHNNKTFIFARRQYQEAYEALVQAMTGEVEEGIEKLEEVKPEEGRRLWLPYVRAHYNRMEEKDFEELARYEEEKPDDPDPFYIRALYYLKQDRHEDALKEMEEAEGKTGQPWICVKEEVSELLKDEG